MADDRSSGTLAGNGDENGYTNATNDSSAIGTLQSAFMEGDSGLEIDWEENESESSTSGTSADFDQEVPLEYSSSGNGSQHEPKAPSTHEGASTPESQDSPGNSFTKDHAMYVVGRFSAQQQEDGSESKTYIFRPEGKASYREGSGVLSPFSDDDDDDDG